MTHPHTTASLSTSALPKSCLSALDKGGTATYSRQDDGSYLCDSPTGHGHALRGEAFFDDAQAAECDCPPCDCMRYEVHRKCSHLTILLALKALCLPGEYLRWGQVSLCAKCHTPMLDAACVTPGRGRVRRVKCACLQGIARVL